MIQIRLLKNKVTLKPSASSETEGIFLLHKRLGSLSRAEVVLLPLKLL